MKIQEFLVYRVLSHPGSWVSSRLALSIWYCSSVIGRIGGHHDIMVWLPSPNKCLVKTKDSSALRFQMKGIEHESFLAVRRDLGYPELKR